jgi:hypothetical protein
VSFMGFSPFSSAVRRECSSPHAALQQCGQEPSGLVETAGSPLP